MAKCVDYAVMINGAYLQGIEANEDYHFGSVAPTMGTPHIYSEYRTIWGNEPMFFEPLTLATYIKTLLEEFRWETKELSHFIVFPRPDVLKNEKGKK